MMSIKERILLLIMAFDLLNSLGETLTLVDLQANMELHEATNKRLTRFNYIDHARGITHKEKFTSRRGGGGGRGGVSGGDTGGGRGSRSPYMQGGAGVIPLYAAGAAGNNNHHNNNHHNGEGGNNNYSRMWPTTLVMAMLTCLIILWY